MDYWESCIKEAFEESEITASEEQIQIVISWVEGAHENCAQATGSDIAHAIYISDEAQELEDLKREIEKKRVWELETKPCESCTTSGVVKDSWGRDATCGRCNGVGRHK